MQEVGALCAPERTQGPRALWCLGSFLGVSLLLFVGLGAVAMVLEGDGCECPVAAGLAGCPCVTVGAALDCAWRCDNGSAVQCFLGDEPVAC